MAEKSHAIAPRVPKPSCDIISSMLSAYYNEQAERYDMFDLQHESRRKYTEKINELIANDGNEYYPDMDNKLAIACVNRKKRTNYSRPFHSILSNIRWDISGEMCQIAQTRGINAIHADWLSAEIPEDHQFDIATSLYAFGHITTSEKRLYSKR